MRMLAALVVGSLTLAAAIEIGCSNKAEKTNNASAREASVTSAFAAERREERKTSADSSPFVAGVWKFVAADGGTPTVDTEFRFINPSEVTATLEYAFFELDGTFCGCDRDDFPPNQTTIYTMLAEAQTPAPNNPSLRLFNCTGTSGALKSIVFKNEGQQIFLDDTMQVGFQTHAFGSINESADFTLLTGAVMTEAPLQGVAINAATLGDVREIHRQCVALLGPL